MAICSYNSKRLIPAPLISISRDYQTSSDGTKVGTIFNLSMKGFLLSFNGSPDSAGTFYTGSLYNPDARSEPTYIENLTTDDEIGAIFRKQEALRELFSEDGHSLEFQAFAGSPPIKCNPRIKNITFQEGTWFNKCDYTIELEADVLYINGQVYGENDYADKISDASESWSIDTTADTDFSSQNTHQLTHTISATGKRFFDKDGLLEKEAWEQAKSYVLSLDGYDATIVAASQSAAGSSRYNYIKGETLDKLGGTYSLTESWILAGDSATEIFNVNVDKAGGNSVVTIDGTITGMSTGDNVGSKLQEAENKWTAIQGLLYTRANQYSNLSLNANVVSYRVSKSPTTGVITYNYVYNNKVNMFTGAVDESIDITQSYGIDIFGEIFVIGRAKGPVLQPLDTFQGKKKSVSISATFPVSGVLNYSNPLETTHSSELSTVIAAIQPVGQVFIDGNDFSWNPSTGAASFSRSWTYEDN